MLALKKAPATVLVAACWLTVRLAAAQTNVPPVSITENGTVIIDGAATVPPYTGNGRWTEMKGKSSARYVTRHWNFMGPSGPPAMELYVAHDLTKEPPNGGFELGMVGGYLSAFSSGAGLQHTEVWDDVVIGAARVKRCRAEMSKGERRLWLYAYVFVRQPSLTFVTIRPRPDAAPEIESYLRTVSLR